MIRYFVILYCLLFQFEHSYSQSVWENYGVTVYNVQGDQYPTPFIGGLNSPQFSEGDLDFDGHMEILLYERASKIWVAYKRDGNGLKYSKELSESLPLIGQDISLLRDYNGDDKVDLIVNNGNTIEFWKNIGVSSSIFQKEKTLKDFITGDPIFHRYFDLPGVEDVDFDGDIDLLIYGVDGEYLEYWKNYSQEYYSNSDSLIFQLKNSCWGHFTENNTSADTFNLNLYDTCAVNVSNPQKMHVGSSVTVFDYDSDGVQDLFLGDVGYTNLVLALNGGLSPNMNSSIDSVVTSFPQSTVPVKIDRFPAAYWIDIDDDGIQDLVVAPNTDIQSNLMNSIHYYKNFGSNSLNLIEKGFLQNDMIDVGKQSYPITVDLNLDGYRDIIIGNYGEYDTSSNGYVGKLKVLMSEWNDSLYYQEVADYAQVSLLDMRAVYPAAGDLDNDNDVDLIVGNELGQLTMGIKNGSTYSFSSPLMDDQGQMIDVGQNSAPTLFDLDNDVDLDLVIGNRNGTLTYYENIGSISSPLFQKVTDSLGRVNVGMSSVYGGFAKPCFFLNSADSISLLVSSYQGWVYEYSNVSTIGVFDLVDSVNFNVGLNPSVYFADLNNDSVKELMIGNDRGGVQIFSQHSNSSLGLYGLKTNENIDCDSFQLNGLTLLSLSSNSVQLLTFFSLEGKVVKSLALFPKETIELDQILERGCYLMTSSICKEVKKIVFR